MPLLRFLALAVMAGFMSACAPALPPEKTAFGNPEMPYAPPRPPQVGDILHLPTGYYVGEEGMLAQAAEARIVYIGETHDNPAAHRVQLRVLQHLAARYPDGLALGMEMFTPAQQNALDRWVAGELDEKDFLRESDWYGTWRMDFAYYRDLLVLAREQRIPVIGLNAERSLVRQVSQSPPAELPAEVQAVLPDMDRSDPYHTAMTQAIFAGHDAGQSGMDGFLRVQTLWDEIMAENIARYLQSPQGENRRMVVLAGGNHVRHGYGIPRRVFRRLPVSYLIVGSKEILIPPDKQDRLMDVDMPQFPMLPYHFLVFTEYESLEAPEVKLGILLEVRETGVGVAGVMPGSPGERAGLQKDDVLLEMDGEKLGDNFDLIYLVKQKKPGDGANLKILRNGEPLDIRVEFFVMGEPSRNE
ncbi:ChaN family lipoprotein [Geoalkalibacter sp.]|uniref:ChaN family lipoprotein n=1 Tax=Geoalkalibacter sp. TaxID=3041440 RepID=UPI00272EAAE5|nr:ChaN family lipoprotein [Geoalkalibacter sp.]